MALNLNATNNPGIAQWSNGVGVVAAGILETAFDSEGLVYNITVPAGLENAAIITSYQADPGPYGISGGSTYSSISGTTLTITFYQQNTLSDGLGVSWAVFGPLSA